MFSSSRVSAPFSAFLVSYWPNVYLRALSGLKDKYTYLTPRTVSASGALVAQTSFLTSCERVVYPFAVASYKRH